MQAVGGFLVGVDDPPTELLQLFINGIPVVPEIFKNPFERLGKGSLKVGIIIEVYIEVVPDGVLDFGGFCLRAVAALHVLLKIFVKDRNWLDLYLNPA